MLRPVSHASRRLSRRTRHPQYYLRFWLLTALGLLGVTVLAMAGWVALRAVQLRPVAASLATDGATLQRQAQAGDVAGAASTLGRIRVGAARGDALTSGPAWAVVGHLPVVGDDVSAVRALTATAADLTAATEPFEQALPALTAADGGRIDLGALRRVTAAMPAVALAVQDGRARLDDVDTAAVRPQVADGVNTVRTMLELAEAPARSAGPSLEVLTTLLGGNGPRTYAVLMQQDAEARGTGGLVGSFAVLGASDGTLDLKSVDARADLDRGAKIPVSDVPEELRDLWGADLQEWAGLNLSPHFPWTGRLVAAGWQAQGRPRIDGVIAVDQYSLAGLLAATGPVTVSGVTVTPENAVQFLSRDVYAKFDYTGVDRVTAELVGAVFGRVAEGKVSPAALAKGLLGPVRDRRVLVWSSREDDQRQIEATGLGGIVPDSPGPFAMAVVNNGGGNKLDAYLRTKVVYDPGSCSNGVRIGSVTVTLESTAPERGLPAYVVGTEDLDTPAERTVTRPTRVLLDVYGPVGATNAGVLVDGRDAEVIATGLDRNHPVWRISVPLSAGTTRTVEVGVVQPTTANDATTATVLAQPMVTPMQVGLGKLTKCS